MRGNTLVFRDSYQDFNLDALNSGLVVASHYQLELVPVNGGSSIVTEGDFIANSGLGNMRFTDNQQGEYQLKVIATDSIGRQVEGFIYANQKYAAAGAHTYLDFYSPAISQLHGEQISSEPTSGQYQFDVTALITEANIDKVSGKLMTDASSGQFFSPSSITAPTSDKEPYTFHYTVPAGKYWAEVDASDLVGNEAQLSTAVEVVPKVELGQKWKESP